MENIFMDIDAERATEKILNLFQEDLMEPRTAGEIRSKIFLRSNKSSS